MPKINLQNISKPLSLPISLADAKHKLRVSGDHDDLHIENLIKIACSWAEKYMCSSLMPQMWQMSFELWMPKIVKLYMPPLIEVVAISGVVLNDEAFEITQYEVNQPAGRIMFDKIYEGFYFDIVYRSGYPDAEKIPEEIKYAIMLHIEAMYEGDDDHLEYIKSIYKKYREISL